jgi:hypothetical protein
MKKKAAEQEAGPSTVIVSSNCDELDSDFWNDLGASTAGR